MYLGTLFTVMRQKKPKNEWMYNHKPPRKTYMQKTIQPHHLPTPSHHTSHHNT